MNKVTKKNGQLNTKPNGVPKQKTYKRNKQNKHPKQQQAVMTKPENRSQPKPNDLKIVIKFQQIGRSKAE